MVLWGRPAPRGYLSVSSVSPEEHGIEGPVPRPPGGPLVGPAQPPVRLPHQGGGLLPQRVRDRAPVPVPWPALLCPRCRPPSLPLRLRRRCRAPPPLCRGHLHRLRPRRRGGWLVLGSWGLGGDELAGVRVVEVVVVVVVVVMGVVCRHLLDAGGDAPHRLHVRLRGRPALCPPPFVPSSPLGSHALSSLSLGARGALALALGPLSSPLPVSRVPPPVPHALARPLSHLPSPCPLHLGSLPVPLRALPVPWPLPGPLPRVAPSAACALLPPAAAPFLDHSPGVPLPLQLRQRDARRRALARRGADVPLPPRGEGLGGERLGGAGVGVGGVGVGAVLRALPAHCCCCGGRRRGVRGPCGVFFSRLRGVLGVAAWPAEAVARPAGATRATPRAPSSFSSAAAAAAGEAPVARAGSVPRVRGVLGVAAWPAEAGSQPAGVAAAAPRAPSSLSFAAVAAADEAPVARAGSAPRFRGVLGVAAWSAEAVVRPAGAAVAIPRAPFLLSSAAAAAPGDAPGSCAGAAPGVGGVPGAAVGAAAWLAGAAVSASCASGAPSRGRAAGLAAWAAEAVISAGSGLRAGGGGPTSTAASASLRSPRSARVSPVHSGEEAGEQERDRRWWRLSRWGDPSESAITVILVGMRGGRRALSTTSWCISAVPWAVPCGALRGGGGEGVGGRLWRQPRTAGGLRPSTGTGRGGGGATRPTRRAIAASLGRGRGPWAPGGRRAMSGGAAPGGPP